jgi:hypothetical protein
MPLFGPPNIEKLREKRDVNGLRAALRHKDWEVRLLAAKAIGMMELPLTATERQGVVPQEIVADLIVCLRDAPPDKGLLFLQDTIRAMARIGGPAGMKAIIEFVEITESRIRPSLEDQKLAREALTLLGVDVLVQILPDEARPPGVREAVGRALSDVLDMSDVSQRLKWRASQAVLAYRKSIRERAEVETARSEALERFMVSSEPSAGEAALLLDWIYDRSGGKGFVTSEPVQEIGRRLHEHGGFQLMLEAHAAFSRMRPAMARNLEMVWDGVGNWRG